MRKAGEYLFVILVALMFILPLVMDRLTPYARACRAKGGVPAVSNDVCYVSTTKTIMQR